MIAIKNLFDPPSLADGVRLWIDSVGLTLDLREWCQIEGTLSQFAPSEKLLHWLADHPAGFDYFEDEYDEELSRNPHRQELLNIARMSRTCPLTLVHAADHPTENMAAALRKHLLRIPAGTASHSP